MRAARAASYDEYLDRMELVFPAESADEWRAFRPRPTDVIISPFSKSGTTWLQQIVHGLRTGGDTDFEDISLVVPWIETAHLLGIDLAAEQKADPRAFKSHLSWHDVPKGGRYIVSFRDPGDAVVSLYHFMSGWIIEPGAVSLAEFVTRRALERDTGPDYWRHLESWLSRRDDPNVLLVSFEAMAASHRRSVARIAEFIGLPADEALVDVATRQSSFEYMSRHKYPFIDHAMRERSERIAGIPAHGDASKVRSGAVGAAKAELTPKIRRQLDRIWHDTIGSRFGFATYEDLTHALSDF